MRASSVTVDLEDTDMDVGGPETTVTEANVVMIATLKEIIETITANEMRCAHNVDT
jgi:hypothetical protein